jgi:hypothetical protein
VFSDAVRLTPLRFDFIDTRSSAREWRTKAARVARLRRRRYGPPAARAQREPHRWGVAKW